MKTHVWIKGISERQYAPIATLVLVIKLSAQSISLGEPLYSANGISITQYEWDVLKEEIGTHASALDNMARGY